MFRNTSVERVCKQMLFAAKKFKALLADDKTKVPGLRTDGTIALVDLDS